MFGIFKKVSSNKQQMLTNLALELLEEIDKVQFNQDLSNAMSYEQRNALDKYRAAASECLKWGREWDGSDNMGQMMWNTAFKQLSAASNIMKETIKIIDQNSQFKLFV